MIRNMGGVVRVSIMQLRNHVLEGIEHVEIGSWIQVGRGYRSRSMQYGQLAYPGSIAIRAIQDAGNFLGDIEHLPLLARGDSQLLHTRKNAGGCGGVAAPRARPQCNPFLRRCKLMVCARP